MKSLLLAAALLALPTVAHATAKGLPIAQLKQDISQKVGMFGKVSIRGNKWTMKVPNGPIVLGRGRALELKAKGTVNRLDGKIRITYENPAAGAAL